MATTEKLMGKTKDALHEGVELTKEKAYDAKDKVVDLKDAAGNKMSDLKDSALSLAKDAKESIVSVANDAKKTTEKKASQVAEFIKDHPKETMAAVVAGIGIFAAVSNRKKVAPGAKSAKHTLVEKAQELGREIEVALNKARK